MYCLDVWLLIPFEDLLLKGIYSQISPGYLNKIVILSELSSLSNKKHL